MLHCPIQGFFGLGLDYRWITSRNFFILDVNCSCFKAPIYIIIIQNAYGWLRSRPGGGGGGGRWVAC